MSTSEIEKSAGKRVGWIAIFGYLAICGLLYAAYG